MRHTALGVLNQEMAPWGYINLYISVSLSACPSVSQCPWDE